MDGSKKNFTFIWKFKNFSFCFKTTKSPYFIVQEMGGTKWHINLLSNCLNYSGCVACYLNRELDDNGPEKLELDYELSFLDGGGYVLQSEIFLKQIYGNGSRFRKGLHAKKDEIYFSKKNLFIPDDILTVQCRMWDSKESITQSIWCSAETRVETECRTIVGVIKNFSNTGLYSKNLVCWKSSSVTFLSSMNLCVAADGKLAIEMNIANQKSPCIYRYQIFIRDIIGNKLKSGQNEFRNNGPHTIPFTVSKEFLMEKKGQYLPGDVLTIECKVTFPTGKTTEKIGEQKYGLKSQEMISHAMKTNLSSRGHHTECIIAPMDNLTLVPDEGVLFDTKLKTATETFPAHTLILSAQSSVFKSMFSTEMKEKTSNYVNIDDLDADTVRRMLKFMYKDMLDDLNYESAKSLYFAADKYNIVSLKLKCSSFLKQNLSLSNLCEILLLADRNQDNDLKSAVEDYISNNSEVVLFADEWKNFEKNNPQLTIEVLRTIYVKSRRI